MEYGLKIMDIASNRAALMRAVKRNMLVILEFQSAAEMGRHCETLSAQLQALAICHFMENLDLVEYGIHLRRSACARRFFLERSSEDGNRNDRYLALSRTEAFFDALAAGSRPLAIDIANASGTEWNPEYESEADFHYFRFLHLLLAEPWKAEADQGDALRRVSYACAGRHFPRLTAAQALLERDAKAFRDSLEAMLESKREVDRAYMRTVPPGDPLFGPRSWLSVEGLALMRLAHLRGMGEAAYPKHPLCPRIALLPWSNAPCEDLFRKIRFETEPQTPVS